MMEQGYSPRSLRRSESLPAALVGDSVVGAVSPGALDEPAAEEGSEDNARYLTPPGGSIARSKWRSVGAAVKMQVRVSNAFCDSVSASRTSNGEVDPIRTMWEIRI